MRISGEVRPGVTPRGCASFVNAHAIKVPFNEGLKGWGLKRVHDPAISRGAKVARHGAGGLRHAERVGRK